MRKHLYNIPNPEEYQQWQKLEQIDKALENVYWYDRDVFKLYYYEGNTLTGLAKKTGISRNSLFTTIDKVREQLKELLDD
jgi:DNA-directed RNA polymerase specialized sigma24 family protein